MPAARALAAVLLLPCALAGCSSAPPTPSPSSSASAVVDWPRVPGRVVSRETHGSQLELRVAVEDPDAAYADARRRLVAAGYGLTVDRPANGGGTGQACTTALCVGFAADTLRDLGPGVTYQVFHSTGVVPLSG